MTTYNKLKKLIDNKTATVGVIGLGYVGLPLLMRFFQSNFSVIGFDNNQENLKILKGSRSTINHIKDSDVKELVKSERTFLTNDLKYTQKCEVVIICLPTPLDKKNNPDLSFIKNFLKSYINHMRRGQLISLESTTYPGTTDEVVLPYLEKNGLKAGEDFFLCYSPEREDPGNKNYSTKTIPKLCAGYTEKCGALSQSLYSKIIDKVVMVSSTKVAEMSKLLENIYRAVNVGLVNEMRVIASSLDIDIYEVIEAASTKPFGFTPYFPGPGLGGHCLPIDPLYLSWKASQVGVDSRFIELAAAVNSSIPIQVVSCLKKKLNARKKKLSKSKILVAGLAYKKNIDDARESPSFEIIKLLLSKGAKVEYSDPYIKSFPNTRRYKFKMKHVNMTKKNLNSFDAIILATDHDNFDINFIQNNSKLIIDTRGVCDKELANVERL